MVRTINSTVVRTINSTVVHTINSTVVRTINSTVVRTVNSTVVRTINSTVVHTLYTTQPSVTVSDVTEIYNDTHSYTLDNFIKNGHNTSTVAVNAKLRTLLHAPTIVHLQSQEGSRT